MPWLIGQSQVYMSVTFALVTVPQLYYAYRVRHFRKKVLNLNEIIHNVDTIIVPFTKFGRSGNAFFNIAGTKLMRCERVIIRITLFPYLFQSAFEQPYKLPYL